jgi:hypothetical protein
VPVGKTVMVTLSSKYNVALADLIKSVEYCQELTNAYNSPIQQELILSSVVPFGIDICFFNMPLLSIHSYNTAIITKPLRAF